MEWWMLSGAILTEVAATLCLRMAVAGKKTWYLGTVVGYLIAFSLLIAALAEGMPLGVAYGIWAASGVALIAILGKLLFNERFTWLMGVGIALIVGGVLLIELGSAH